MSAAQRNLARLPLEIFEDLIGTRHHHPGDDNDVEAHDLRASICTKLQTFRKKKLLVRNNYGNGGSSTVLDSSSVVKTVGALLKISIPTLVRALDPLLTYEECIEFVRRICVHCAPKPATALSLLRMTTVVSVGDSENNSNQQQVCSFPFRFIPTCLDALDEHLRGGFRLGSITELVGKAGTAKTQLAMQLCVVAASFGQGSVYIDTEQKWSVERFCEIAAARQKQQQSTGVGMNTAPTATTTTPSTQQQRIRNPYDSSSSCKENGANTQQSLLQGGGGSSNKSSSASEWYYQSEQVVLNNVIKRSPTSTVELLSTLKDLEDEILLRNHQANTSSSAAAASTQQQQLQEEHIFPVRLLVLDSIAAPARRDFGAGAAPQRAAAVIRCAQILKRLADQLQLAIVVVNQIGGSGSASGNSDSVIQDNGDFGQTTTATTPQAALGTSWHHCVSTRILLEQCDEQQQTLPLNNQGQTINNTSSRLRRQATVVKSNLVGRGAPIGFTVTPEGIVDVADDDNAASDSNSTPSAQHHHGTGTNTAYY